MDYVMQHREIGGEWAGKNVEFKLKISNKNSELVKTKIWAKNWVCVTYLNGAPIMLQSRMEKTASLSVSDAGMNVAVA